MKLVLCVLLLAASACAFRSARWGRSDTLREVVSDGYEEWEAYKWLHSLSFDDESEESEHMLAFLGAQQTARQHNEAFARGDVSFEMDAMSNSIAHLPHSEYMKLNGYRQSFSRRNSTRFLAPMNVEDVPETMDWRQQGYVTGVKDQAQCGSCWAFSATGSLEGQHMRSTGKLVSLSEQNLVDCSKKYGNNGCNGGLMDNAFRYIRDNKGIDTEASYPYEAVTERTCKFTAANVGAEDTGYVDITQGDEEALKKAVATQGPISVAIDASRRSFHLYKSGVYSDAACSSTRLDHGVLVVGYGTDPTHGDFWIVKNSWGTAWGDAGYILMSRNKNNQCGIATAASYPTV